MVEGKIRVLIVDDHQVVRQGLKTLIGLQPDIEVSGEAADGGEAIEMVKKLKPDIVLMDLVMPKIDGIVATRQIMASGHPAKVIALTSFAGDENIFPALEAGASSYLLKDVSPEDLLDAIRASYRGETRLHPDVARKLMEKVARPVAEGLTARELDVIRLVGQGLSNHEIAQKLFISEKTVKTHVSNILGKLHLSDRTRMAIYALKNGLTGKE